MNTRRTSLIRGGIITVVFAASIVFTSRKVDELSANPTVEKDCGPDVAPSADHTLQVQAPVAQTLPWAQKGGTINDASCLNRTSVFGIVRVKTEQDIAAALSYARKNGLKVSIAGVRHSMGGQAFYRNAVVLDMRDFNQMSLDEAGKVLTVQTGATWHAIQRFLHPRFAVKAMQSTDIFTVGGSIAVNAHGMDHQAGAVGRTVRSMRIMLADGTVQTLSRTENPELFNLVLGGYGLFGVVLDAQIEVTDNEVYETGRQLIDYKSFPELFSKELVNDPKLGLFYGHLSTSPDTLLDEMILYTYKRVELDPATGAPEIPPLGELTNVPLRRFVINFAKTGPLAARIKWWTEKNIEPRMESCTVQVSRNQALKEGEACLVSRNEPMHDSVSYLKNSLKGETDILQEYFIPRDQFIPFVDGLRTVVRSRDVNLLNASVRIVHQESNFLNYAPADAYSIVLYINQITDEAGAEKMQAVTRDLIDLTQRVNGRFFLPYQLYYTSEQLRATYPEVDAFFEAKRKYDPQELLTNTWYERYR